MDIVARFEPTSGRQVWRSDGTPLTIAGLDYTGRILLLNERARVAGRYFQVELAIMQMRGEISYEPPTEAHSHSRVNRRAVQEVIDAFKYLNEKKRVIAPYDASEPDEYERRERVVSDLAAAGIEHICAAHNVLGLQEILLLHGFRENELPSTVFRWRANSRKYGHCRPRHADKGRRPTVRKQFENIALSEEVLEKWLCEGGTQEEAWREFKKIARLGHLGRTPGSSWFYKLIAKRVAMRDVDEAHDAEAARTKYRLVVSSIKTGRALERVEWDAYQFKILVTPDPVEWSRLAPGARLPRGCPSMVLSRDYGTRMPCGYCIGFGKPNAAWVMSCKRLATRPKDWLSDPAWECKEDWPVFGKSETDALDNALKFHGMALQIANGRQTITLFVRPRIGEEKSVLERFFKFVHEDLIKKLPGAIIDEKLPPPSEVLLTISEFVGIFTRWLVQIYMRRRHPALGKSPYDAYTELTRHRVVREPMDYRALDWQYAEYCVRTLDKNGIDVDNVNYFDQALFERLMFIHGASAEFGIRHDRLDLGKIGIIDPRKEEVVHAVKARNFDQVNGLSKYTWDLIRPKVNSDPSLTSAVQPHEVAGWALADYVRKLVAAKRASNSQAALRALNLTTNSLSKSNQNASSLSVRVTPPTSPSGGGDKGRTKTKPDWGSPDEIKVLREKAKEGRRL
jgi:hypothetical protein